MKRPAESAGRWLERRGNAASRGMTVIPRKGRNRIPLTGLLHTSFLLAFVLAVHPAWAAGARAADPSQFTPAGDEVPFVVTPGNVTRAMLDIAGVGPRDTLIDLGSGDGRIVIGAAQRGASALGVEIDPNLVAKSEAAAREAGVASRARFVKQDLFDTDLQSATVVTMYLLQEVNLQLRPRLLALAPGTRVVSHDWHMGEWQPDRRITVEAPDKPVGREKSSQVMLWVVPARVGGLWCGDARGARARLAIRQTFQFAEGSVSIGAGAPRAVRFRLSGEALALEGPGEWRLRSAGAALETAAAGGEWSRLASMRWRPSPDGSLCPAADSLR